MTTTRPACRTGSVPPARSPGRLGSLVLGTYRLALRARLQRRPGAALLERPLRTLAAAAARTAYINSGRPRSLRPDRESSCQIEHP